MQRSRCLLIASLLAAFALPLGMRAQEATPSPEFGVAEWLSPLALYEALLATPFPAEVLPTGIASLEPFEWRDSSDANLKGAVGGVIHADGDPFGSDQPNAIVFVVYPNVEGPQAPLATVAQIGEAVEIQIDGQGLRAIRANLGEVVGLFTAIDNVFVYGMAPPGDGAEQVAESLTTAGIAYLLDLAGPGDAADTAANATPMSGMSPSGEDLFMQLAAAPFPTAMVPFEVGSLVVLPMNVSGGASAKGLVGALLVRDADRSYPYPLVFYRFYADDAAALADVSGEARGAGASRVATLPPEIEFPYKTTMIDHPNDTTEVLVQVGATVVVGNAPSGDLEERHAAAMTLAQIAVSHLEAVAGAAEATGAASMEGDDGSPGALYEALLAATFPDALLPQGVAPLETSPWQDANDPDLAGSLGGVTYSNGDAMSLEIVNTVSLVVFPDQTGAEASLATAVAFVEELGVQPRPCTGVEPPSVVIDVASLNVCIAQVDNVAISGIVLGLDGRPADERTAQATSLTQAGIVFLGQIMAAESE